MLPTSSSPLFTALFLGALATSALACSEPLEGPERTSWETVDAVTIDADHAMVRLYGSANGNGAHLDRWQTTPSSFAEIGESNSGRQLGLTARCAGGEPCEVRYDLEVSRSATIDATLGRGEVHLYNTAGPTKITLDQGQVRGQSLESERVDVTVRDGDLRLHFLRAPLELRIHVEGGQATLLLPDQRYRCEFDQEGPNLRLNGIHCHGLVDQGIFIHPPDAHVRFEFH